MFYHIVTFGCQMNVHESEKLAGTLSDLGYDYTDSIDNADIIVFNTCAIREGAQDRAFGNIGALKKMKKANPNLIIAVCGCMTQQKNVADHIYKTFPFVDIIFGTHNAFEFKNYVLAKQHEKLRQNNHMDDTNYIWEDYHALRTSGENAWVNIMYGCNNFCSYCIVPYVRGREKSRDKDKIINEIKTLVATGKYKTITLLGQNVNSYGHGLYEDYSFADLLKDICAIDGDFKLTFMTSHPKDISDDVIEQLATQEKMVKYLHLPMQSGSNRILQLMNRKYTKESYLTIISKLKAKIPDIRITSDFIVGFPTETDEDFEETCDILRKVKYDGIFAFMYSVREGTVAEKMEGQIDQDVKNARVNKLLNLQKEIQNDNRPK